jgi:hypothetical protein
MKCEARCEVEYMDIKIDKDHSIVGKNEGMHNQEPHIRNIRWGVVNIVKTPIHGVLQNTRLLVQNLGFLKIWW